MAPPGSLLSVVSALGIVRPWLPIKLPPLDASSRVVQWSPRSSVPVTFGSVVGDRILELGHVLEYQMLQAVETERASFSRASWPKPPGAIIGSPHRPRGNLVSLLAVSVRPNIDRVCPVIPPTLAIPIIVAQWNGPPKLARFERQAREAAK